jgi:hypothetical protein
MTRARTPSSFRSNLIAVAAAVCATAMAAPACAQSEGGLYIAGYGFTFQEVVDRAIKQNPGGRRFFLLSLPPQTSALMVKAAHPLAAARDRVLEANGVLLVCQRDIDDGRIKAADLAPRVVPVRGWPPAGSQEIPLGKRYFKDEERSNLPASNEALRRLRSTCTDDPASPPRSRRSSDRQ